MVITEDKDSNIWFQKNPVELLFFIFGITHRNYSAFYHIYLYKIIHPKDCLKVFYECYSKFQGDRIVIGGDHFFR